MEVRVEWRPELLRVFSGVLVVFTMRFIYGSKYSYQGLNRIRDLSILKFWLFIDFFLLINVRIFDEINIWTREWQLESCLDLSCRLRVVPVVMWGAALFSPYDYIVFHSRWNWNYNKRCALILLNLVPYQNENTWRVVMVHRLRHPVHVRRHKLCRFVYEGVGYLLLSNSST